MKLRYLLPFLFAPLLSAQDVGDTPEPEPQSEAEAQVKAKVVAEKVDHRIIIEAPAPPQEVPLFYSATIIAESKLGRDLIRETALLKARVIQGKAEKISVQLGGSAQVKSVDGVDVKSWSVRREGGARFLDLFPNDPSSRGFHANLILEKIEPKIPGQQTLTTYGPGSGSSLTSTYEVASGEGLSHRLVSADGMLTLQNDDETNRLTSTDLANLVVALEHSAAAPLPVELRNGKLSGTIDSKTGSANFTFTGTAFVSVPGTVTLGVLRGRAAPVEALANEKYRLRLGNGGYEVAFNEPGTYPLEINFVTPVQATGEWKTIDFFVPSGAIVPVEISGLEESVIFNPTNPVVPIQAEGKWQGFLPANGCCQFAWQPERQAEAGRLFYTSESMGEISVGAGLLRQVELLTVKTLQGSLPKIDLQLAEEGEILSVEGENVLSWSVVGKDLLEIVLSRPVTKEASFVIRSQTALNALPVKVKPLRMTPAGAVRHSGFFRVYNRGAVRIELMETAGLTQLSPDQYPEATQLPENLRQVFHYRFPSANRSFTIAAERIKPEVNVSQTLSYELTETDRVLHADLELEIREAPIREWELLGPADYSVVAVTGAEVADYVPGEPGPTGRRLKVIFANEVIGRRLVKIHFEKNETAVSGAWDLPQLKYPGSQVVRGELGVTAVAGFRLAPAEVAGLVEMPLVHFVNRGPRLQQAYRIKGGEWSAAMKVEALSQNIQADVFHHYSLKEGTAYVSVLVNYFITGAPVNEWKITLPEGLENLNVEGRDVRDSRTTDGVLTVPLHRPVMGAYLLLLTYEQSAEDSLQIGGLIPIGVQGERGFLQVVSPGQVELTNLPTDQQLISLDPLELPAEYQLLARNPSLAAWQYNARPFDLNVGVSWFNREETARQVVEYAEITSRLARDGGVVTTSIFDVRSRGNRSLELLIPEGLELRDITVDGSQVTIREAGEKRLIPLPATSGPQKPVRVEVRTSSDASGERIAISAPTVSATTQLMTSWKIVPDTGYALKPVHSGGLNLLTEYSHQSGFSWIEKNGLKLFTLLILLWIGGSLLMRIRAGVSIVGAVLVLVAAMIAISLGVKGLSQQLVLPDTLEYRIPVAAPDELLKVTVGHAEKGESSFSDLGLMTLLLGMALAFAAWKLPSNRRWLGVFAGFALSLGLLTQVGGAGWFFLILAFLILWILLVGVNRSLDFWRDMFRPEEDLEIEDDDFDSDPDDDEESGLSPSGATAILLAGIMSLGGLQPAEAEKVLPVEPTYEAADSLKEIWTIKDRRLAAKVDFQVTAEAGDRFLIIEAPATLTGFDGEGLRVVTEDGNFVAVATKGGIHTAKFTYQLVAPDVTVGLAVPTGVAAVHSLDVQYEAAGWSIDSPASVRKEPLEGAGSKARLWLAPERAVVTLSPKARDVAAEETKFYVEVDDLFIPGPGVVDGRHRIRVRPAQGEVRELSLLVPSGFTVSDVMGKAVGPWRFDPEQRILSVKITPFQAKPFQFLVETQRPLAELPSEVVVSPMRVRGTAGEVGMLALAFGREAQLDQDTPTGMSPVNLADFSSGMLPRDRQNKPTATLQKVYRYSKDAVSLKLKVAPVAPEVRVTTTQRLSFGEDRVVLACELNTEITRAGVFRLSFYLPDGFEVESLTGAALNHWAEIEENKRRLVTMNLNGKTLGSQAFSLVLASNTPDLPVGDWSVPKIVLREAARQSGQLVIVPGRGIQLEVGERKDLSSLDPRTVGGVQPGAVAFQLLKKSWLLKLSIDQLDASLSAKVLQDVELRENRSMTRIDALLEVENASIRDLEIILPGLSQLDSQVARASGAEVRDLLNIEGDRWQVRFKRRVIGKVPFRIEFEQHGEPSKVETCRISSARQQETFLALRPGVRQELKIGEASGWDRIDWVSLSKELIQPDRSGAPVAFLRSTRAVSGVEVSLKRLAVVSGAKLRVLKTELLTVLSPTGELMNQAELEIETLQRGSLDLVLPENSRLFGVFVNEVSALLVQNGNAHRFQVTGDAGGSTARVRFTYATTSPGFEPGDLKLEAFKIGVPLTNMSWLVSLPEGYNLSESEGDLDLDDEVDAVEVTRNRYLEMVSERNSSNEQRALGRLGMATNYSQAGDQKKTAETLEQVFNQSILPDASNEDVRVQYENVATRQTVLALNTRLQRNYFDNRGSVQFSETNEQIEQGANANPIFAGELNFGNDDYANVIGVNGAEVNRVLDSIATRWIRHQGVTEPVGQMLDPVIPVNGKSVIFVRKMQVDGDEALSLNLELESEKDSASSGGTIWIVILIIAALAFLFLRGRFVKS